jgi:hypothetical protein
VALTLNQTYYTASDTDGQAALANTASHLNDGVVSGPTNLGPSYNHAIGADIGSSTYVNKIQIPGDAEDWSNFKILYNSSNGASGWVEVSNLSVTKYKEWEGGGWTNKYLNEWTFDSAEARWWKVWAKDGSSTGVISSYELDMFEGAPTITFTFTSPSPTHQSTVYGNSQTLQLIVTISGSEPSYTYDATFYNATASGIISTVSGTSSGQPVSTNWSTVDGGEYFWYLIATSSGSNDTSSTYEFTKKYKCAGYVEIDGTRTSGIPVRLYLRSDGELVGFTTSAGISGTFEIDTLYNENHYCIALFTSSGTNALIYDYLKPGE